MPPPQPEPARTLHSSLQLSSLNPSASEEKTLHLLEPDWVTTSTAANCLSPRILTTSAAFEQTGSRA